MYIQSNEMNMTAPVLFAINPNIKVFRTQQELRPGGRNITADNLMQVVRGLIA